MARPQPTRITSFLVKIASRCNLACDYCYVYRHADQSWRDMPALMDEPTRRQLAARIGEYARSAGISHLLLVFHGGEPLLAGPGPIIETAEWVRAAVPPTTQVDVSLQTNGLLLTEEAVDRFSDKNISVSVSIDGPPEANDLHRLTHGGGSSFAKTLDAVRRLERHPAVYAGLIAVVDPGVPPEKLLAFFHDLKPPRLDFLLPDGNHLTPPPGRDRDPDLYLRWLLRAFDLWFDHYPDLKIRTFDSLLESIAGLPSNTDAFGFGDVSLLTVETDGSYHDLDVLKITRHGGSRTGLTIWENTVEEVARSPQIEAHRELLTLEGLSPTCRECPVVSVCGGGAVPHRYAADGFNHPTVYCREMLALIGHAKSKVRAAVTQSLAKGQATTQGFSITDDDVARFSDPSRGRPFVERLHRRFAARAVPALLEALGIAQALDPSLRPEVEAIIGAGEQAHRTLAVQPSVVLWISVTRRNAEGVTATDIDGVPIPTHPGYVRVMGGWLRDGLPLPPRLHRHDPFLRLPFGKKIHFEPQEVVGEVAGLLGESLSVIRQWDQELAEEISRLSPEVQFIRDPSAHPDKAVSFSDNSVPGALYVSVRRRGGWIGVFDLADSIIHEHRHQKLYLLQSAVPIVAVDAPLVRSPWREEPRPPSGLFHAVFVFCGLLGYWQFIARTAEGAPKEYAAAEVRRIRERLD